jgi:phosphoglycerol transferase MdoB-like AlkP superfamily enzyme
MGYRTLCIHPYTAGFYNRSTIFPGFGFDRFLDIQSFAGLPKSGPYIGDTTLAEKICTELAAASDRPLLIFAITMENHGPLHWEQPLPGEEALYTNAPFPQGCEDLTIYLRHLANADRMAGLLDTALRGLDQAAWLCWFGDHVPIMPQVYARFGFPDGRTDYLIWSNRNGASGGQRMDRRVEDLGLLLLEEAGLILPEGFPPAEHHFQG